MQSLQCSFHEAASLLTLQAHRFMSLFSDLALPAQHRAVTVLQRLLLVTHNTDTAKHGREKASTLSRGWLHCGLCFVARRLIRQQEQAELLLCCVRLGAGGSTEDTLQECSLCARHTVHTPAEPCRRCLQATHSGEGGEAGPQGQGPAPDVQRLCVLLARSPAPPLV